MRPLASSSALVVRVTWAYPPKVRKPIAQGALFDEQKDHQDEHHDGGEDRLQHGGEVPQERRALGLHRHGRRRGRRGRRGRLPCGGDVLDGVLEFPEHAPRPRVPHLGDLLLEIARVGRELRREGGELRLDGPSDGPEEARGQYHDEDGGQHAAQPPMPEGGDHRGQQKGQEQREGHGDEHGFGPIQQGQGHAETDEHVQKWLRGDFFRHCDGAPVMQTPASGVLCVCGLWDSRPSWRLTRPRGERHWAPTTARHTGGVLATQPTQPACLPAAFARW